MRVREKLKLRICRVKRIGGCGVKKIKAIKGKLKDEDSIYVH
nr:hypothetical protein [uncultured Mediterraneibacter sp.]